MAARRTDSSESPNDAFTAGATAAIRRAAANSKSTAFALAAAPASLAVMAASALVWMTGWTVVHPATGRPVAAVNLISIEGLHRLLTGLVSNFTNFAPLGTVLVAMLGIAVAEGAGLIAAALKLLVLSALRRLLTLTIVFAGVMSNTGGEVGYVLLLPLSAMVFAAVGRHPERFFA